MKKRNLPKLGFETLGFVLKVLMEDGCTVGLRRLKISGKRRIGIQLDVWGGNGEIPTEPEEFDAWWDGIVADRALGSCEPDSIRSLVKINRQ